MLKVTSSAPINKVTIQALATAITALLLYVVQTAFNISPPAEIRDALNVLISTVVGFAAGYMTPLQASEVLPVAPVCDDDADEPVVLPVADPTNNDADKPIDIVM